MVTEKVETVEPETMSVDYACALLGIGRNLGYELARQGRLPGGLRLGRRVLVSKKALETFLAGKSIASGMECPNCSDSKRY
jgi:excisionase family DNA binding protein